MALELRPGWCLDEMVVGEILDLAPWSTADGRSALDRDGDEWKPGDPVRLHRDIRLRADAVDLRRRLGLRPGATVGVACRWTCRTTSEAGTHVYGPAPLPLAEETTLVVDIPPRIGGTLELETCLLVRWTTGDRSPSASPDGAMIWSDGWTVGKSERTMLLEGDEQRVPVRSVPFSERFGRPSGALWTVDLDPSIGLVDLLPNVVTVLLNREVLDRDFKGPEGDGDAALVPASAAAGIQVDLVRSLTIALRDELNGDEDWKEMDDGSVGSLVVRHLMEAFDSVEAALANLEEDEPAFNRELWHRFAPTSWRA